MRKEDLSVYIGIYSMKIVDALKKIDENSLGVLFIVDEKEKLIGAMSDGDIRRWLIKTGDLQADVVNIMNKSPKYLKKSEIETAHLVMAKNYITAIPVVDDEMHIIDVVANRNSNGGMTVKGDLSNVPVVMMAGGKGTRLYPYTKILPKPLIPVGDKPIAEHIIDSFREYKCKDFYMIINHKRNMIKAYFNEMDKAYRLEYIDEDIPLGTGGGVSLLKDKIDRTFILTNCDVLVEDDYYKIYQHHKEHNNMITLICSLKNFNIPYGIVNLADEGTIKSMEEKPTLSFFTNTGCYIVEPEVIGDIPKNVSIGFPDIIEKYRHEGKKIGVYPIGENAWLDMGQMDELEKMKERFEKS